MADRIRIIKHEAVLDCGSYEVRLSLIGPAQYFYWDDLPARRLRSDLLEREDCAGEGKGGSEGRAELLTAPAM